VRLRLLAVTIGVIGLAATPAVAHEEFSLHALTVLDRVTPDVPGVEIRVVHLGAPALAVVNRTSRILEVSGVYDEPFLRIGPDGVLANAKSPTTYMSIDPNHDVVPPAANPAARPRWVRFTGEHEWSWFDPRLAYLPDRTEWAVPMKIETTSIRVGGGFEPLEGHGHFITKLDAPRLKDVDLRLIQGPIPAIFARNDGDRMLRVAGAADEPFLRIGPGGVWANLRSPSYYNGGSLAIRRVPSFADATAPPRWAKVSAQPTWGWLEYRAALAPEQQERDVLGPTRRTIHTWTSPMSLGRERVDATGRVIWVPPVPAAHHATSWTPLVAVATSVAALCLLAAASLALRRRRQVEPA
jgi:hypothetical protein